MLSCTGAGFFIGETEFTGSFPFINSEFHQVVKKKTIPKPKSFYSQRKNSNDFAATTSEHFSFFPILNDPALSKLVGLKGEIIKKYDSSPAPVTKVQSIQIIHRKQPAPVSPVQIEIASSKIAIPHSPHSIPKKTKMVLQRGNSNRMGRSFDEVPKIPSLDNTRSRGGPLSGGEELNAERTGQTISREIPSPVNIGSSGTLVSYVVQVSSFRQWQRAEVLRDALGKKRYAAFIGKIELPDNRGTWYRVYIGRYFNRAGAERAATRFYREENRRAMVIRQTG